MIFKTFYLTFPFKKILCFDLIENPLNQISAFFDLTIKAKLIKIFKFINIKNCLKK